MTALGKNPKSVELINSDLIVRFNKSYDNQQKISPTIEAYGGWQYAFDYFKIGRAHV